MSEYKFTGVDTKPADLDTNVEDLIEGSDMDDKTHSGCTWRESDESLTIVFATPLSGGDETKIKAEFSSYTPSGF